MANKTLYTNRASSTLLAGITAVATSVSVASGEGAKFPALTAGQQFRAVIQSGDTDVDSREYVIVTARAGDVLTIVRAQEGSTGTAFLAGHTIAQVVTAAGVGDLVQAPAGQLLAQLDDADFISIASAATTSIGALASNNVTLTGIVTISSFGAGSGGFRRRIRYTGAGLTLTYNAASMILPGNKDISVQVGDIFEMICIATGNWVCIDYSRSNGSTVAGAAVGGGSDRMFYPNDQSMTASFTTDPTQNYQTTGPITVPSGVVLTVSAGSNMVVL